MNLLEQVISIAYNAGDAVMKIYEDPAQDFELDKKDDDSPLTKADLASHEVIVAGLEALDLGYPIMSEESEVMPYETRKDRKTYRCIDPLDGTKEFIKRNGEFTINIALIQDNTPIMGVVFVPVQQKMYAADAEHVFVRTEAGDTPLRTSAPTLGEELKIIGSRSHHAPEVQDYVDSLKGLGYETSFVSAGSSLKFCMIAEGLAHVYPRFIPTMERDTAAAHCILDKAGGSLRLVNGTTLSYNRENLRNDFFIAVADEQYFVE